MSPDRDTVIDRVNALLQQFGLEMAFVDPVNESGVDGIGGLLGQIEDQVAEADDVPDALVMAMIAVRRWIDDRIAADGRITADTINRLNEWQPWMVEATTAWKRGQPLPGVPAQWSKAAAAWPVETPARPAPPRTVPAPAAAIEAPPPPPSSPVAVPPTPAIADQQVSVIPDESDPEMLQLFCAEAQDLLQEVEQGVLVLETNPTDAATLNALFRAFHTFKGNVGVIKLTMLQQFTHEMESLLDAGRKGTVLLGRDAIGVILEGADLLERFVGELAAQLGGASVGRSIGLPIPRLIAAVDTLLAGGTLAPAAAVVPAPIAPTHSAAPSAPAPSPSAPPPAAPLPAADVAPLPPSPPAVAPPAAAEAALPSAREPSPEPPAARAPATVMPAAASPALVRPAAAAAAAVVRVDTLKLDGLIDLVGELVIAQSMVVQNPELAAVGSQNLSRTLSQLRSITTDLQRTAMALRMVPVRSTFQKMSRLVRDLALQQGKEIQLVLEGEDTELDRGLVEDLGDPLVHMIRNSADHGIELPDARAAAGKSRQGTIRLRAFHQGGFIVIEITDDGRGLVPEKILAKAIERGLVSAEEKLETRQIFDLIFAPGFSTAEKVTDLSGRGVGMDVVRRNIERLRGKIEIDSEPGRGTRFTISLPLTLAIIEAVIVGVGDQRYVIPTLSVRESFRPRPGQVTTVQGKGEAVSVRGRLTPVLRLGQHFQVPTKAHDPTEGIVVVVESGQDARCLFVDDLIGKQEVVIKSLGDLFRNQNDFAGAAILGDGRIGLILDVNALVKLRHRGGEAA
jgi:two-component system chemotaxis sensor kinase CheA